MSAGDDALAGGATAAFLHGVSLPPDGPVHIITPNRPRNRGISEAVLHRPLDLHDLEPILVKGIATTSPFRTLLDTAAWDPQYAQRVLEYFLVSGDLTIRFCWRQLFVHATQGRPGIRRMKSLLNNWDMDTEQPESVLEARMLALCFMAKLPPFEFQAQVGDYRVDFLWRAQRAILECDGFAYHGSARQSFENDRRRDAELQAMGFTVWRFSFRQIMHEPKFVTNSIRRAFSAQDVAKSGYFHAENP
jgi:very-short-patch-repair endonuclease